MDSSCPSTNTEIIWAVKLSFRIICESVYTPVMISLELRSFPYKRDSLNAQTRPDSIGIETTLEHFKSDFT